MNIVVNMIFYENELKKGGKQLDYFNEIKSLGVNKIEVRREYIKNGDELAEMNEIKSKLGLEYYYSVPDVLFTSKGINFTRLAQYLSEAQTFGCHKVKLTAGEMKGISKDEVEQFNKLLEEYEIELFTLENDQTQSYSTSGKILALLRQCQRMGMKLKYTYDPANYEFVGENAFTNYEEFLPYIGFVHIKDIELKSKRTTLLYEGGLPWRDYLVNIRRDFGKEVDLCLEYPAEQETKECLEQELNKVYGG